MSFTATPSNITMDAVFDNIGPGMQQLEDKMSAMMQQIQSNPAPSQSDLLQFQALTSMWSNLIQLQSSVLKVMGDTAKTVVNNTGT